MSAGAIATYSIVARDPASGDLGVAVQSRFFAVGCVVPWARAGVGAIATQASGNTTFGPRGLDLLASGMPAQRVLEELLSCDPESPKRQVGIVDASGRVAHHTGTECMPWAGARAGSHYCCQGNILADPSVVTAMARAFDSGAGAFGARLLGGLDAAEAAGGDARGMQSAALLIVRERGGYGGFDDRYCDLRVDDAPDPLNELRRLFELWKLQALSREGYVACGAGEFERALETGRAAVALDPVSGAPEYDMACYLALAGHHAEALDQLRVAVRKDPRLKYQASIDRDLIGLQREPGFEELTCA